MSGPARRWLLEVGKVLGTLVVVLGAVALIAVAGGAALDALLDDDPAAAPSDDAELEELTDRLGGLLPLVEDLPAPPGAVTDESTVRDECVETDDGSALQPAAVRTWELGPDLTQARTAGVLTIDALQRVGWELDPDPSTRPDGARLTTERDGDELVVDITWAATEGGTTTTVALTVAGAEPCG